MNNRTVLKNSTYYMIGSILKRGIGFIMLPIYTYFLSVHDYGQVNILNSFIQVMIFIVSFSAVSAVSRFYVQYKDQPETLKRFLGSMFVFIILSGSQFILVGLIFQGLLSQYVFKDISFYPLIFITLLTTVFITIYSLHQQVIIATEKGLKSLIINVSVFLIQAAITLYLIAVVKLGALGIMSLQMMINALYMIYAYMDLKKSGLIKLCLDTSLLITTLKYSLPLMPHNLSTRIAAVVSRVFINHSYSLASVAVYGVALQFGSVVEVIQVSVNKALKPHMFKVLKSKKNHESIYELTVLITLVYTFFYVMIGLFSVDVIGLLLPEAYIKASRVIPVILIGYAFKGLYYFYLNIILYYFDTSRKVFVATVTGSFVNILLMAFLVPRYEMLGAAMSFSLAKALTLVMVMYIARPYKNQGLVVKDLLKIVIVGFVLMMIGLQFVWSLKVVFGLAYVVYVVVFYRRLLASFVNKEPITLKKLGISGEYEPITKATGFISFDGRRYFLKRYRYYGLMRVIDAIRSNKLQTFKNEIAINRVLKDQFNHPSMKETDGKYYMMYEVVNEKDIDKASLIDFLVEMKACKIEVKHSLKFKLETNLSYQVMTMAYKTKDPKLTLRLIGQAFKARAVKRTPSQLVHGDLLDWSNILFDLNGQICLVDFEYMRMEDKWQLIDIVDLSFNRYDLSFDINLFESYLKNSGLDQLMTKDIIHKQVKNILIRRTLGAIKYLGYDEKYKQYLRMLLKENVEVLGKY